MNVIALILAGGSGTRFWPASRASRPKQLLSIAPGSSDSLIAETVARVAPLCPPDRVVIATGAHLLDATRRALPRLPESAFIGEPVPRNAAACIAWGTSLIARRDPDALVMALPSDHHIGDTEAYLAAVELALASARTGAMTTLGLRPERAETGYGYIEGGEWVQPGIQKVVRFVEKPTRERAAEYVASGRYYWNSGMFFFRARDMLAAVTEHMPALATGLAAIEDAAAVSPDEEAKVTRLVFQDLESVSIDYGVMEKVDRLNVVPASFGWSDLGSWEAAYELSQKDAQGNAADADTIFVQSSGNLVRDLRAPGVRRVIALVGVQDLCVVETDDALLVIPRERAQDVRAVVKLLEERGNREKL